MTLDILIIIAVIVLFFFAFLLVRTMMFGQVPEPIELVEPEVIDGQTAAAHLSRAIQFDTLADPDLSKTNPKPFLGLIQALEEMYPRLHATLERQLISEYSLLYTWKGKNPELEPILLGGHIDVVPADPATLPEWKHEPFSGDISDEFIWGRGALDTKCTVIGAMEAVEILLEKGYQPERTIYLAFGADEEVGGALGAAKMSAMLQEQGVRLAAVLDEGGVVSQGALPGVKSPVALIGIAEKGLMTMELTVDAQPGHSSTPPRHTAIGTLSIAINRLENHPMPASLNIIKMMFQNLGPELPFGLRFAFANLWLMGGVVKNTLEKSPVTNATLRTTAAVTMINGGVRENVLPARATATVNYRLMPGTRIADAVEHTRKVVNNEAVQIRLPEGTRWEAPAVSRIDTPVFNHLVTTVRQMFPAAAVTPYLVVGATDSRYYSPICDNVYRFCPYLVDAELLKTMHGINERLRVSSFERMVQFYLQLIRGWAA